MKDERHEGRPTAYVLGEMSPEERERFEAEMKDSADLRAEVEEIREMADLLSQEMASQKESLSPEVRARIDAAAVAKEASGKGAVNVAANDGGTRAPAASDSSAGAKVTTLPVKRSPWRRISVGLTLAATLAAGSMFMVMGREARFSESEAVAPPMAAQTAAPAATAVAAAPVMAARPEANEKSKRSVDAKEGRADVQARARAEMQPGASNGMRTAPGDPLGGNRYDTIVENPFLRPATDPLSTFSIDVDTASYSLVRTYLQRGSLPPAGAVRIEEMVNYFTYDYAQPEGDVPFRVALDVGACPWAPSHKLVRVGLKGKERKLSMADGVNLVFLVDTSGSMSDENKLPLLKQGFQMLVDKLGPTDRVAIVAYAGSAGLVLPSTPVSDKATVLAALDRLSSGGSTNGGAGIELAYKVAAEHFLKGGVNRVVLATDGDFNVGTTSNDALVSLIQDKAKTGVFLSVLGFGMGNFNDSLLEKIADKGNGQYAYIDNATEAKRVLVDGMGSLMTIAKDVKIQIEMNPAAVSGYRLIGYENRTMAAQDFNNDKKDAGELGSGHTVTALYEIVPAGVALPAGGDLEYQAPAAATGGAKAGAAPGELLTVKLRYKEPEASESKLLEEVLKDQDVSGSAMSADFKFAAAVASFGMLLRGSKHAGNATYDTVLALAESSADDDDKRREFVQLVRRAKTASRPAAIPE